MPKKSHLRWTPKDAYQQLKELLNDPVRDLLWHYRVGEQVQRLCPERAYGSGLIENLAEELGADRVKLSMTRTFSRVYRRAEVKALNKPSTPGGYQLTWWHMVHLLSLEPDDRDSFQRACLEEEWSCRELRRRIKENREPKGNRGRRFGKIESVESGLRQLIEESESWHKRFRKVWFHAEEPAIPAKSSEYRSKKAKDLARKAVNLLETLQSDIDEALSCLRPQTVTPKKPNPARSKKSTKGSKRSM